MKSDNLSRRRYEAYYRLLRMEAVDENNRVFGKLLDEEIIEAADYSYQAHGYWVSGWMNTSRRNKFYSIKVRMELAEGDLPF